MATKKQLEPVAPATDKKKALANALSQIEKQFGKGSVMRLGENTGMTVEHIPTGSIGLDLALGIGGLPRGRIIEIYGPESSGKTTVALHSVAEAQKLGGTAAFIDAEHALDPVYAKALGVDIDSLLVSQPDTGEQGLDIAEALVRSGAVDIVVIDSVAVIFPLCALSAAVYYVRGGLPVSSSLGYLLGGAAGGVLAGRIFGRLRTLWLRRAFALLILYGGSRAVLLL